MKEGPAKTMAMPMLGVFAILFSCFLFASCSKDIITEPKNHQPEVPSSPSPVDGAINQSVNVGLDWECSDPDNDQLFFDVYFGTNVDPQLIGSDVDQSEYYSLGELSYNTVYYWKVVAKDGVNLQSSPTWEFGTSLEHNVYLRGTFDTADDALSVYINGQFAYVADGDSGLQILDISDPINPTHVSNFNTIGRAGDVFILGLHAFVADGDSGVQILDTSNPYNPLPVARYSTAAFALKVFVNDDFLYIAIHDIPYHVNFSAVDIVDISTPAEPLLIGRYNTENAFDVYVSGQYAYIADLHYLWIVDISDPANPIQIGNYEHGTYPNCVIVIGNYAYLASLFSFQILDISIPASPTLVGSCDTPGLGWDIFIENSHAYIADGEIGGLVVINIENAVSPTLEGRYYSPGHAFGVFVFGDYIYLADVGSLKILEFIP
jgi:hypothetical protein